MAADLAAGPRTGLDVQANGDAHLSNFGFFASPERTLVFDVNDFDETARGPWEWDIKRLATSVAIAGRQNGFTASQIRAAVLVTVHGYRETIARYAQMRLLDIWYDKITADDIDRELRARDVVVDGQRMPTYRVRAFERFFTRARRNDGIRAANQLATTIDGVRRIIDDPPMIQHVEVPGGTASLGRTFEGYWASMAESRRELIEQYRFVDFALKVVGVGSVGTRCFIILLEGRDVRDPLVLQAKEATASVLAPHVGPGRHANNGERVVVGQRLTQATPDIFLGWARGPDGRDYYFRQLWDMKGSVDVASLLPAGLGFYGRLCARSLARVHARTGDAVAIAAYLGTSDRFDGAIADFAEAYATQNAIDLEAFRAAIASGRIRSVPG